MPPQSTPHSHTISTIPHRRAPLLIRKSCRNSGDSVRSPRLTTSLTSACLSHSLSGWMVCCVWPDSTNRVDIIKFHLLCVCEWLQCIRPFASALSALRPNVPFSARRQWVRTKIRAVYSRLFIVCAPHSTIGVGSKSCAMGAIKCYPTGFEEGG